MKNAGTLDIARAAIARRRAPGQIDPSKYLPGVPRQVHKDGGKADFLAGNHPLVPDVLYHGTSRDISSFDPEAKRSYDIDPSNPGETDTGWFGKGHYFTSSPKMAAHYADEGAKRHGQGEGANIMPVHVALKNPFVVDMKEYDSGATTLDKALTKAGVPMHPRGWRKPSEQTAALMAMGHDGVIATREGKPKEYVVFRPEQIKSAISAREFDPTNPDMTKAGGGPVDLNIERARKNIASEQLPKHIQDTFNDMAERHRAQVSAYQAAMQAGAFNDTQVGDEFRAPDGSTFKVTDHHMVPVDRWGGKEPPQMVYEGHFPRLSTVYTDPKMKGFDRTRAVEYVRQMPRIAGPLRVVKKDGGGAGMGGAMGDNLPHWTERTMTSEEAAPKLQAAAAHPGVDMQLMPLRKGQYAHDDEEHDGPEVWVSWLGRGEGVPKGAAASAMKRLTDAADHTNTVLRLEPDHSEPALINYYKRFDFAEDPNGGETMERIPRPSMKRVAKADGGGAGMGDNGGPPLSEPPVDLGVHSFHRKLGSEMQETMNDMVEAHQKALQTGVFDGYDVGDRLQGRVGPLTIKARYMAKWKPGGASDKTIQRMGQIPTLMDHNGVTYHPMLRMTDADGSEGDYPLDAVRVYPKFTGLRVAKANGGSMNLYSKAARIIRGLKEPKMDAQEMVRLALKGGAKKAELEHADVAPGMASRDQVADYIEAVQPRIGVVRKGEGKGMTDQERDELGYLSSMMPHQRTDETNRRINELRAKKFSSPQYEQYQLPGGTNYREHILTLDDQPKDQTYTARNHWGKIANPLAHIRMSDRMTPDGRKILHVEEMQSDWNSDARRKGFRTGNAQREYDDFVDALRKEAIDKIDASPMVREGLVKKYQAMEPHTLAIEMDRYGDYVDKTFALNKENNLPPKAPYVNPESDDWAELAMKHVLTEAAKGGYDGVTFTPDAEQSARWRGTNFKGMYDKKFPGIAVRLAKQHDPSITPSGMELPSGTGNGAPVDAPMIPLTDTAKRGILQNGFSSFMKGGYVR